MDNLTKIKGELLNHIDNFRRAAVRLAEAIPSAEALPDRKSACKALYAEWEAFSERFGQVNKAALELSEIAKKAFEGKP